MGVRFMEALGERFPIPYRALCELDQVELLATLLHRYYSQCTFWRAAARMSLVDRGDCIGSLALKRLPENHGG